MNKFGLLGSLLVLGTMGTGCAASTRTANQYRDDTARVFAAKDPELQACYAEARNADPAAQGTVTVGFRWSIINAPKNSRVPSDVKVLASRSTAPASLQDCALKTVRSAVLTPDGKGIGQATWTFTFDQAAGASSAPAATTPKS
jgi:hypothetical protein